MTPTIWNKLVVICLLAGLCLVVAACGRAAEPVDEGPNAHLSNDELLAIAVENMLQAESYHSIFRGGIPADSFKMSQSIAITAEVQAIGRGSRFSIRDEAEPETVIGPNPDSVDLRGGAGVDVLYTAKESYHSYDGGETWTTWGVDTPQDYLIAMFVPVWKVHEARTSRSTRPSMGEQLVKGLTFRDGTPRLEVIDRATTRHMVAQREPTGNEEDEDHIYGFGPLPTGTINLWVSTDMTPTIRQMRIEASTVTLKNRVHAVKDLAISSDGKSVAVAHDDGQVRLWELAQSGGVSHKLKGELSSLTSVDFSPDGKTLAVGVHNGGSPAEVRFYDLSKPDAEPVDLYVPSSVSSIAFSPDGEMLGVAASNGIYLWRLPYEQVTSTFLPHPGDNVVNVIAFSPDDQRVASGNLNAGVRVYDLQNLKAEPLVLDYEWVEDLAFSPDGHLLAAAGGLTSPGKPTVKIWDLRQPNSTPLVLPGDQTEGAPIAFSPDNRWLATEGPDGQINLWEVSQLGSPVARPLTLQGGTVVSALAFSNKGAKLVAGNGEGEVLVWDLNSLPNAEPRVLKEDEQLTETPYTLHWKWSRFNEDFGKVEPPPPDTIKPPY